MLQKLEIKNFVSISSLAGECAAEKNIRETLKLAQIALENTAEGARKCKFANKSDLHVKNISRN